MGILQGSIHVVLAVSGDSGLCVDVREIGSDSGSVDNIIERQVGDQVRLLQEQREGLSDSSGSAANDDYLLLPRDIRREALVSICILVCRCRYFRTR